MALFGKRLKHESEVTFTIEAKDAKEAQELFDKWMDNDENTYNVSEKMHNLGIDLEEWITVDSDADFYITKPKPKEPKYDLHITYRDDPKRHDTFSDRELSKILSLLDQLNSVYILHPSDKFPSPEMIQDAKKRDTCIIMYEAERRK